MKQLIFLFALMLGVQFGVSAQDEYRLCDASKIYIFDHPQLKKKVDKPLFCKKSAMWEGKADSLQQFYDKYLHFTVPKEQPIQRVILTFVVDCNGNPGEFNFENKENWPIQAEILKVTKEHMDKWIPAEHKKGQKVDCRQVIIFTIANGKVKVAYREAGG